MASGHHGIFKPFGSQDRRVSSTLGTTSESDINDAMSSSSDGRRRRTQRDVAGSDEDDYFDENGSIRSATSNKRQKLSPPGQYGGEDDTSRHGHFDRVNSGREKELHGTMTSSAGQRFEMSGGRVQDDLIEEDPELEEDDFVRDRKRAASLVGVPHDQSAEDDDESLEGYEELEESQLDVGPILPDSFRRSPRDKGRSFNADLSNSGTSSNASHMSTSRRHQPGAIVRVKLINFVTYTVAEFHPGPNLNMVIGPNGTGKSTLVCAICLGLGFKTDNLGRAKDVGEFVKHGEKSAIIEIELAANPSKHRRNPIVTNRITRDNNKSEFSIDGKKVNHKTVKELMKSFSIQIDNLCQFLPQDRVVEFARLSPVRLLTETQKAAAPEQMTLWHEELKILRKEQKEKQITQQTLEVRLKKDEDRQRDQAPSVQALRERHELQDRMASMRKHRPWVQYREARIRHGQAKKHKKTIARELRRLRAQIEPHLEAVRDKEDYVKTVKAAIAPIDHMLKLSQERIANCLKERQVADKDVDDAESNVRQIKEIMRGLPQHIANLEKHVDDFNRQIENGMPEKIDVAAMNEQIRELERKKIDHNNEEITKKLRSLDVQVAQRAKQVDDLNARMQQSQTQEGQQEAKLDRQTRQLWQWVKQNRQVFNGQVYGPPIVECTVEKREHAAAVEQIIGKGGLHAFTVSCREDFDILTKQMSQMRVDNITIRTSTHSLESYRPPMETQQLERFGLECWVRDLIDGPDAVIAMLCDDRQIHKAGFTSRDLNDRQEEALKASDEVKQWCTSKGHSLVRGRREYGSGAVTTRFEKLRQAQYFTDTPADHSANENLNADKATVQADIDRLTRQIGELREKHQSNSEHTGALDQELKKLKDVKKEYQRQLSDYNGIPVRRDQAERKLEKKRNDLRDFKDKLAGHSHEIDELYIKRAASTSTLPQAIEACRVKHKEQMEAKIILIEAVSDHRQILARHEADVRSIDEHQTSLEHAAREEHQLLSDAQKLYEQCQDINQNATEGDETVREEIADWETARLDTEIEALEGRIAMSNMHGGDRLLQEFEKRAEQIEKNRTDLRRVEHKLNELEKDINETKGRWEPRLDELVAQISHAFSENFARIQCMGEVGIHKDEDFDQWAIEVKVKFRENESLSVLDNHRQSGGERAVSTIFYLMALQTLSRAPFRVVDEINQGMDPRNERLVHSRMVDIACGETRFNNHDDHDNHHNDEARTGGGQYFLITPKLLSNLRYHPNMTVHCIASGEYLPAPPTSMAARGGRRRTSGPMNTTSKENDETTLDFRVLAERALAVRLGTVGAG